ncbi:MAG TPA: hypothetical protein VMA37_08790 [Acetobacteraceae bacterium]|nr:hypothetical protein [Acetobacteraceae bacterium]
MPREAPPITLFPILFLVRRTLANPSCTSDHCLVLADALDELITALPAYGLERAIAGTRRLSVHLRSIAPRYAR